ncbi:hypothetical protein [Ottowia sp.]|uniref:hypothetical protein n=1 Tax=Ottowia sp. TaxID=1898956 RepID=UPI0025F84EE7|nr:hypothetical protein [Ottowia sp.]MBK6616274.1 hypothetical protein [Ottowia sp.]
MIRVLISSGQYVCCNAHNILDAVADALRIPKLRSRQVVGVSLGDEDPIETAYHLGLRQHLLEPRITLPILELSAAVAATC